MKVVKNKLIPFNGYLAINLFGVIFTKVPRLNLSEKTLNHEAIHTAQMKELLYVPFYVLYLLEYLIKRILFMFRKSQKEVYRMISFEREAKHHEYDFEYLKTRRHFEWVRLIIKDYENK